MTFKSKKKTFRNRVKKDNDRENSKRITHEYQPGDEVLIERDLRNLPKLDQPTEGPYKVLAIRSNGTIVLDKGLYMETINIRRVRPFSTNKGPNAISVKDPLTCGSRKIHSKKECSRRGSRRHAYHLRNKK